MICFFWDLIYGTSADYVFKCGTWRISCSFIILISMTKMMKREKTVRVSLPSISQHYYLSCCKRRASSTWHTATDSPQCWLTSLFILCFEILLPPRVRARRRHGTRKGREARQEYSNAWFYPWWQSILFVKSLDLCEAVLDALSETFYYIVK